MFFPVRLLSSAACVVLYISVMSACSQELQILPNGMQVVVHANHDAPVAAVRVYVRTGSMYEQEYLGAGISHLFEHLINGGTTTTRSEVEINDLIDRLGGANNAYTTKAHTCYHITTSAHMVYDAIDLLADWMINSTFPQNEFDREMGIVIEELKKGREEPRRIIYQALYDTVFEKHPVHYPTIGYENQVQQITHDDILVYYERMYVPNNMVLVVTGDFDRDEVFQHVERAFRQTPELGKPAADDPGAVRERAFLPHGLPAIALPAEPPQMGRRFREIHQDGLGGTYFRIVFRTVPITHADLYPLDILSYVLSRGRSSRLVKKLQEDLAIVSSISSYSHTPEYDAGVFVIYGNCRDENVDRVIATVLEEIYRAAAEPVTEEELAKAKRLKVADDILGNQTASDEAADIGINILMSGNPRFSEVYLKGIANVTAADILAAAPRYFFEDNLSIVLLRPGQDAATVAATGQQATDSSILKSLLPNGLRLLVKRNPNQPLVNLQVLFLGGVRLEPAGQAGVSKLTAELLTRGTTTRSRNDIAEAFDRMGGRLSAFSANNTFGIEAEVMREDLDVTIELLQDIILNPVFDDAEFATVQAQTLDAIARRSDRWDREVSYLFRHAYFTDHPYRHDRLGEEATVKALTSADCRAFFERHAVPAQGIVTVFGDIDEGATVTRVTAALQRLDGEAAYVEIPGQVSPTVDREIRKTVKRGLASLYIGYPGLAVTDTDDRYAMQVLDAVLSGIGYPGGWLHTHLRGGDRDLVYTVHAFNFIGIEPGYFGITAASSPDKMDEVIRIIREDVDQIRAELVTPAELDKAKTICITMNQLDRQTNSDRALQAAVDELYGLGYTYGDQYAARIQAITAADVRRVARKYLTHHVLVRTGPESAAE